MVIAREYFTRVRKRSFLVLTILVPILFAGLIFGSAYLMTQSSRDMRILVKDESGGLFENKIRGLDIGESLVFKYNNDSTLSVDDLKQVYSIQGYDGLMVIDATDFKQANGFTYYSDNHLGAINQAHIEKALTDRWRELVAQDLSIENADLDRLNEQIEIRKVINDESAAVGSTEAGTALGYIMGFLIYMYLIYYGIMVMRGVIEEKANRIVEVVISSLKPFQLMMGKILGIGAVGLTQFSIWAILILAINFVLSILFGGSLSDMETSSQMNSGISNASPEELSAIIREAMVSINWARIIFSFIFYFVFGYILYAALFAVVGSAVSDDGEANTFTFPIMLPIIASFVMMSGVVQEPNSSLAIWSSMIPFTSPILMLSRIPFDIPWYQQLISMFILVVSCLTVVWLAARIYRVGILMQGKKASFKEIWKWMRHSV